MKSMLCLVFLAIVALCVRSNCADGEASRTELTLKKDAAWALSEAIRFRRWGDPPVKTSIQTRWRPDS
jgi:hypothetical protein